jgi:hypothetical protein
LQECSHDAYYSSYTRSPRSEWSETAVLINKPYCVLPASLQNFSRLAGGQCESLREKQLPQAAGWSASSVAR